MNYRIRSTGEVKSQGEIRKIHSNTSLPKVWDSNVCASLGIDPVFEAPKPDTTGYTQAIRNGATQDANGNWVQAWTVVDMFQDYTDDEGVTHTKAEQEAAYQAKLNEGIFTSIQDATQQRLDDFARTRNYDGMLSLCTYATSSNLKFQAEGSYGVDVRDATWSKLYEILAEVEAGTRPLPSGFSEIEGELPVMVWPN